MNPHFFTAPFYFAFIWFRVQGSRFRVQVAASPPFFRRWYSRIAFSCFTHRLCYNTERYLAAAWCPSISYGGRLSIMSRFEILYLLIAFATLLVSIFK